MKHSLPRFIKVNFEFRPEIPPSVQQTDKVQKEKTDKVTTNTKISLSSVGQRLFAFFERKLLSVF